MLETALIWIALGISAGLSPGPTLALLTTQTLRYGLREGLRVSIAPLFSDVPVVLLCLFTVSRLARLEWLLGAISLAGAAYLSYLGWEALRMRDVRLSGSDASPGSFRKALTVNLFNPHVYVFWFTVGGPMLLSTSKAGWPAVAVVLGSFYGCLVGSKALLAVLLSRSRAYLKGPIYRGIIRALGLVLIGFAAWLAWHGFRLLRPPA